MLLASGVGGGRCDHSRWWNEWLIAEEENCARWFGDYRCAHMGSEEQRLLRR